MQPCSMLLIAVVYQNEDVVVELLKKRADPNLPNMKVNLLMWLQNNHHGTSIIQQCL